MIVDMKIQITNSFYSNIFVIQGVSSVVGKSIKDVKLSTTNSSCHAEEARKPKLYTLSQQESRARITCKIIFKAGLEPATYRVSSDRDSQLHHLNIKSLHELHDLR